MRTPSDRRATAGPGRGRLDPEPRAGLLAPALRTAAAAAALGLLAAPPPAAAQGAECPPVMGREYRDWRGMQERREALADRVASVLERLGVEDAEGTVVLEARGEGTLPSVGLHLPELDARAAGRAEGAIASAVRLYEGERRVVDLGAPPVPPGSDTVRICQPEVADRARMRELFGAVATEHRERLEEDGPVSALLRLLVGRDGSVLEAEVRRSSGSEAIDAGLREAALELRFRPGSYNGVQASTWHAFPVTLTAGSG